jgi:metal-dependent amidase/aminoacylase/carboxypeptidase family protein
VALHDLERLGYRVDRGCHGLPTAFMASIGTGDLHIGICAEYDALPGLGHACGHNIIASSAVGAAAALAPLVDDFGLTVSIIGTPAEEGGGGKILLLERGAFNGLHAAMMIHPGPTPCPRPHPETRRCSASVPRSGQPPHRCRRHALYPLSAGSPS